MDRLDSLDQLSLYKPYSKQQEFHAAGADHRERLFMAGNQLGKTLAGGMEVAMHLTGKYPDWWEGKRFDKATRWWAASDTSENTRKGPQRILVGEPTDRDKWGTGTIPAADLLDTTLARSIPDAIDSLMVQHVSGDRAVLYFKTYEQGRQKWQNETLDGVWCDEEPPPDIYSEGLTRTNATNGIVFITATPLLGMSQVVMRFYPTPETPERHCTQMTIDDAGHYTAEEREKIIASYPEHEREARAKGIPMLGAGRVFPIIEEAIQCKAMPIPSHWPRIGGMDFGWDHPFGAVDLAHDRDTDTVYVIKTHRARQMSPLLHSGALKPWDAWLPWAWPRDGRRETLEGAGIALASQYRDHGLNMLTDHAQFDDKSVSVEAGLMDMLDRMQTGRFKVFDHLDEWFQEFRTYHRVNGLVVKEHEDLLCATRYALMMLRFAKASPRTRSTDRGPATGSWMG